MALGLTKMLLDNKQIKYLLAQGHHILMLDGSRQLLALIPLETARQLLARDPTLQVLGPSDKKTMEDSLLTCNGPHGWGSTRNYLQVSGDDGSWEIQKPENMLFTKPSQDSFGSGEAGVIAEMVAGIRRNLKI